MEQSITENTKNVGAIMHGSTFLKYCFPFANFFAPLFLWTIHKNNAFLDTHGKQALNFQLSILVYALGIGLLSLPFVAIFASDFIGLMETISHSHNFQYSTIENLGGYVILLFVFGMLFLGLFIFELYYVITATIKASKGETFKYPFCIPFISSEKPTVNQKSTITDEQVSEEHISEEKR